jgi:hypothetical protein
MHCFTLTEKGVVRGIKVGREVVKDKTFAGIKAGSDFLPFHPDYSTRHIEFVEKYRLPPEKEVVTNLEFDKNHLMVPADPREKSDYALALVDVLPAEGGKNEITASVKQEYLDNSGLVQRTYRSIGDAVGIRVYYPISPASLGEAGDIDISNIMEIAAGGNLHVLKEEKEVKAREECLKFLSSWTDPLLLIMLPGSTFRVFRSGKTGDEPKVFSFKWLWNRGYQRPSMKWDIHEPKELRRVSMRPELYA